MFKNVIVPIHKSIKHNNIYYVKVLEHFNI